MILEAAKKFEYIKLGQTNCTTFESCHLILFLRLKTTFRYGIIFASLDQVPRGKTALNTLVLGMFYNYAQTPERCSEMLYLQKVKLSSLF